MNATTYRMLCDTATNFFHPELMRTEDIGSFAKHLDIVSKNLKADVLARSIECFDAKLRHQMPSRWTTKGTAVRTIITKAGASTYRRTVFEDEYGRPRYWADELLGIPPRKAIMADTFVWIAERAAYVSYRKVTEDFEDRFGVSISPTTVMRVVHAAGSLIRRVLTERDLPGVLPLPDMKISQDKVFVECDGLWIALQATTHRPEALSRKMYSQVKEKKSLELKCACVYAGKAKSGSSMVRGHTRYLMLHACPEEFWDTTAHLIEREYVVEDISQVWVGTDAGGWCVNCRMDEHLPESTEILQSLDPFHVLQKAMRAFPQGSVRDWINSLIYRRRPLRAAKYAKRYLCGVHGTRRKRIREFIAYIEHHVDIIAFPKETMGTMEGTNASVWAARMKAVGCSWSERGAEAMGLIRSLVLAKIPIPTFPVPVRFTESEVAKAASTLPLGASAIQKSVGQGYLPAQATFPLEKAPGAYLPTSFLKQQVR